MAARRSAPERECDGGPTWAAFRDRGLQEPQSAIDLAQPALAVDVLGVLAAVALRRSIGDLLGDPRALFGPQLVELGAKLLRALRRDVPRALGLWRPLPRRHSAQHIRYA